MTEKKTIYNTAWRKMSTALYAVPKDSRVYGTMDIDITKAEQFIKESRANGKKITITHLATSAIGRILGHNIPELNCYIKRGKFIPRDDVIVCVSVNMNKGQDMTSVRVSEAHMKTVFQIGKEIREKAAQSRQGTEEKALQNKYTLSKIPWPFRRWVFVIIRFIHHGLGFELPSMGLKHDSFGSILLSNIGSHGLSTGMAALLPAANVPAVIIMGKAEEKPIVRDGKIVIRTMMSFTATMDHRSMDGFHGGLMAYHMKKYLENPEILGELPVDDIIC